MAVIFESGLITGRYLIALYADGIADFLMDDGHVLRGNMTQAPFAIEVYKTAYSQSASLMKNMPVDLSYGFPAKGYARFSILTPDGLYVAEDREKSVTKDSSNPYAKLADAMQKTLYVLRSTAPLGRIVDGK